MQQARAGAQRGVCRVCAHSHTLTHVVQTVGPDAGDGHRQEGGTPRPWLPSAGTRGLGEGAVHTPGAVRGTEDGLTAAARGKRGPCPAAAPLRWHTPPSAPAPAAPCHRTELSDDDRQAGGPSCPELLIGSEQTP